MNRQLACALLLALPLVALGCTENLGACDDPARGRDTVLVAGKVQFGGQAIVNESCAGCHGSQVRGSARRGAPIGLDFDLYPAEGEGAMTSEGGSTVMKADEATLNGLRERQRRVFELRNLIWAQVKEGLMPPDGVGAAYRALERIFDSKNEEACTRANRSYRGIFEKESMDVLRNWLACNAPIVETTGEYPECAVPGGADAALDFDTVYEQSLEGCKTCHATGKTPPFLDDADTAYESLVDKASSCDGRVYVVPGDVEGSYVFGKVSKDKPECGNRMPFGAPLSDDQIDLLRRWIEAGAPRDPPPAAMPEM